MIAVITFMLIVASMYLSMAAGILVNKGDKNTGRSVFLFSMFLALSGWGILVWG